MRSEDEKAREVGDGMGWRLEGTYGLLPEVFYEYRQPDRVPQPKLLVLNEPLCRRLGLEFELLNSEEGAAVLAGQRRVAGSRPLAMAYAGHQFGNFTMLGDGRALLLGEQICPDGARVDLHWKGTGPTRFARRGDGKAAVGPMLREFLIGEFFAAVGIPASRALAVVATGETIYRERPLPGAILTRVASSHLRVGTFQFASLFEELEPLRALTAYTIWRHFPELAIEKNPALALLQAVCRQQARLIAQWMNVGFVHGVMNTDNMAISGETIDFGPCAFLDTYRADAVFSSIDHYGRYAFSRQPAIAQWNLARFAESLLPLLARERPSAIRLAEEVLEEFPREFHERWMEGARQKFGLLYPEKDDFELIREFFDAMEEAKADFTVSFRRLSEGQMPVGHTEEGNARLAAWYERWERRLEREGLSREEILAKMREVNPAVIPRNHKVNEALEAAVKGDLRLFNRMVDAVRDPFEKRSSYPEFREAPSVDAPPCVTFCGT